jgi:diguanylate cyclase (GGDEF)-like protein
MPRKISTGTYGHPAGDKVLQQISSILAENTRSHEVAARYGGEEFTVVLPRSNIHKAEVLAERLRTSVKQLTVYGQTITLSIGIAACPEQGSTRDEIINIADQALLEAKALGRDQVRIAGKVKN